MVPAQDGWHYQLNATFNSTSLLADNTRPLYQIVPGLVEVATDINLFAFLRFLRTEPGVFIYFTFIWVADEGGNTYPLSIDRFDSGPVNAVQVQEFQLTNLLRTETWMVEVIQGVYDISATRRGPGFPFPQVSFRGHTASLVTGTYPPV